ENYHTSHEHNVDTVEAEKIPPNVLLDLPLTFQWADGSYAAITEAALRQYAGMSLMRVPEGGDAARLVCKLTPRADGVKVRRSLPLRTPWRVVMLADRPGALLESNTIHALNEPCAVDDVSWIRPGMI